MNGKIIFELILCALPTMVAAFVTSSGRGCLHCTTVLHAEQSGMGNPEKLTITAILATALLTSPVANAADIAKGQQLFQANCAGCHAGGQNFVSEKRTLKKEALEQFRGTTDKEKLQQFVQKGMPHSLLPLKLEESDYSDVVSYVVDQALGDKW